MVSSTTTVCGQLCAVFALLHVKKAAKLFNLIAQEHVFLDKFDFLYPGAREKPWHSCRIFSHIQQHLTSFSMSSLFVQRLWYQFFEQGY